MLLCIDIGNTNIKLGLFNDSKPSAHWRIATDRAKLTDEYAMLLLDLFAAERIQVSDVTGCAISSVVPPLTPVFTELARRYLKQAPVIVGPGVKTGISIRTDHPAEVGADLIVNAVAARQLYGVPVVIIGFGTATTFSAVSAQGDFGRGDCARPLHRRRGAVPLCRQAAPG